MRRSAQRTRCTGFRSPRGVMFIEIQVTSITFAFVTQSPSGE